MDNCVYDVLSSDIWWCVPPCSFGSFWCWGCSSLCNGSHHHHLLTISSFLSIHLCPLRHSIFHSQLIRAIWTTGSLYLGPTQQDLQTQRGTPAAISLLLLRPDPSAPVYIYMRPSSVVTDASGSGPHALWTPFAPIYTQRGCQVPSMSMMARVLFMALGLKHGST